MKKLIAFVVFVASLVAGIAAFKNNIHTIVDGDKDARIILEAAQVGNPSYHDVNEEPILDSIVVAQTTWDASPPNNALTFRPTDNSYTVQSLAFQYPHELGISLRSSSGLSKLDFDNEMRRVKNWWYDSGYLERTSTMTTRERMTHKLSGKVVACSESVPVAITTDFIGGDQRRHDDTSLYYLDILGNEHESPPRIRSVRFDRRLGTLSNITDVLESTFQQSRPKCQTYSRY